MLANDPLLLLNDCLNFNELIQSAGGFRVFFFVGLSLPLHWAQQEVYPSVDFMSVWSVSFLPVKPYSHFTQNEHIFQDSLKSLMENKHRLHTTAYSPSKSGNEMNFNQTDSFLTPICTSLRQMSGLLNVYESFSSQVNVKLSKYYRFRSFKNNFVDVRNSPHSSPQEHGESFMHPIFAPLTSVSNILPMFNYARAIAMLKAFIRKLYLHYLTSPILD